MYLTEVAENLLLNRVIEDDLSDLHDKLSLEGKEQAKSFTPEHFAKMKMYNISSEVNYHMRNPENTDSHDYGKNETIPNVVSKLKDITNNKTNHDFHVYRGIRQSPNDFNTGDTVHDKAFTSTSLKRHVASSAVKAPIEKRTLFKIHVTPGVKGHYLSAHGESNKHRHAEESEFLLHPGTTFKVHHKDEDGMVHLDIHHQED